MVLISDADEQVTPEVKEEVLGCIARADQDGVVAYQIPRKNYKQGFRDGLHGLVSAALWSLHTFARYARAWELLRTERATAGKERSW
ncbi:MAG: hypothetical protein ACREJ6_15555 [Candidatus Methylomirabilis sp.]